MRTQSILLVFGVLRFSIVSCTTPTPPEPLAAPDLAQIKTEIQAMEDAFTVC